MGMSMSMRGKGAKCGRQGKAGGVAMVDETACSDDEEQQHIEPSPQEESK